ncbi:hypothetical protein AMK59_8297 [Oryctes borbonicus]|uniref:Uncharacterized protein n=1 Tax=Oryctes borbonicus TaxID=1629725 RepID=A0A0T6AUW2_9SCAR|nr:hypothetical protein AMK59_8297 [Oryctes borbonicus]
MKVWERRLMKDFKVAPINSEEMEKFIYVTAPENEDSLSRFRRIAKMALLNSSLHKWRQVVKGACLASQIGHCNSEDSLKKQQDLRSNIISARQDSTSQQSDGNLISDGHENDVKFGKSSSSLPASDFPETSCKCERTNSNWKQLHSRLSFSDGVLSKSLKERERKRAVYDRQSGDYKNTITYNESDEEDIENLDETLNQTCRRNSKSNSILLDIHVEDAADFRRDNRGASLDNGRGTSAVDNGDYFDYGDNKQYSKGFK